MRLDFDQLLKTGEAFLLAVGGPVPAAVYTGVKELITLLKNTGSIQADAVADKLIIAIKAYEEETFDKLDKITETAPIKPVRVTK